MGDALFWRKYLTISWLIAARSMKTITKTAKLLFRPKFWKVYF